MRQVNKRQAPQKLSEAVVNVLTPPAQWNVHHTKHGHVPHCSDLAKPQLFAEQRGLCVYCERRAGAVVEHFHPQKPKPPADACSVLAPPDGNWHFHWTNLFAVCDPAPLEKILRVNGTASRKKYCSEFKENDHLCGTIFHPTTVPKGIFTFKEGEMRADGSGFSAADTSLGEATIERLDLNRFVEERNNLTKAVAAQLGEKVQQGMDAVQAAVDLRGEYFVDPGELPEFASVVEHLLGD
jgi:uncharacterized protein (TIGR02646 family)